MVGGPCDALRVGIEMTINRPGTQSVARSAHHLRGDHHWWVHKCGGGATRSLPWDGGVEELHRDPTVGPRPKVWTSGQKWKK